MAERIFGHIPNIIEGDVFENRIELSHNKVHRPTQAGISGSQKEGADSIVLSGGYEDDQDLGDIIIYTGHGGRDLNTKKQVTHQILSDKNLALAINCQNGLPVRVIRGANHKSIFSPEFGYRYDGLYNVVNYWKIKGKAGYDVWLFRLEKAETSIHKFEVKEDSPNYLKATRTTTTQQRIDRDYNLTIRIKEIYDFRCQVCNTKIFTNAGFYAEAAHIKPLGEPHNGPDTLDNLLCLCPNHHVMFDYGGFAIDEDFSLIDLDGKLNIKPEHEINREFVRYHREHFTI
ncbi:YDG/SRA domain-containing protein [Pontibacter sp. HSC-36F09]|uniref:YDG/SRA domain-containing protein n=1 Tax=Pontibacter sp. HSC-36F09 TaxID=2910966 RepID=UPI00209E0124|nr:YDG/SRA domain-containing protein [Pontibacter sp. HSC-36F09]MCP2043190.1 putative restriction endonuclease [Pontibacter sp. HSC-36F09]